MPAVKVVRWKIGPNSDEGSEVIHALCNIRLEFNRYEYLNDINYTVRAYAFLMRNKKRSQKDRLHLRITNGLANKMFSRTPYDANRNLKDEMLGLIGSRNIKSSDTLMRSGQRIKEIEIYMSNVPEKWASWPSYAAVSVFPLGARVGAGSSAGSNLKAWSNSNDHD